MTQATTVKLVPKTQTCSQCSYFNDYNESNGRGWCELFGQQARKHHQRTNDCASRGERNKGTKEKRIHLLFTNTSLHRFLPFYLFAFLPQKDLFADTDPIDAPHPTFAIDSVVKVIDPDEHHTEWASFVVIGRKYNSNRYRDTEAYLTEPSWYFLLTNINYQDRVRVKRKKGKKVYVGSKSILLDAVAHEGNPQDRTASLFSFVPSFLSPSEASPFWVKENDICEANQSHLIRTDEIF